MIILANNQHGLLWTTPRWVLVCYNQLKTTMVNQQLVEYVKSQFALGASRDSIRSALVGAGWADVDVDDSVKSAEALPMADAQNSKVAPTTISMSDLIPNSRLEVISVASGDKWNPRDNKEAVQKPAAGGEKKGLLKISKPGKSTVIVIVLAVFALGSAAGAIYFYFQNKGLNDQLAVATTSAEAVNAKIGGLNSEIANLTKARDELSAKASSASSLADENAKLKTEISFFVAPLGSSVSQAVAATVKGVLSGGGKALYVLTAEDGLRVFVKNSKDAKIDAILKPLLGSTVEISGMHLLGSNEITVTSVNGTEVQ